MFGLIPRRRNRNEGAILPRNENALELMRREFESVFDRFIGGWPMAETPDLAGAWGVDWKENDKEMTLRAELPGFDLSEIDVQVAGDVLNITAAHKAAEGADRDDRQIRRSFTLPSGLEAEKVEAVYRNGVLEVHLPKTPAVQPRKIEVKA